MGVHLVHLSYVFAVIVGDDADLVLMACVSWKDHLYVANTVSRVTELVSPLEPQVLHLPCSQLLAACMGGQPVGVTRLIADHADLVCRAAGK
jgi:hypothetical protein